MATCPEVPGRLACRLFQPPLQHEGSHLRLGQELGLLLSGQGTSRPSILATSSATTTHPLMRATCRGLQGELIKGRKYLWLTSPFCNALAVFQAQNPLRLGGAQRELASNIPTSKLAGADGMHATAISVHAAAMGPAIEHANTQMARPRRMQEPVATSMQYNDWKEGLVVLKNTGLGLGMKARGGA
jgi:hypothetical protein